MKVLWADIVAPIRAIISFFQMSLQPSMCVARVEEIDLTPFERSSRLSGGIERLGLHAPNMTRVDVRI